MTFASQMTATALRLLSEYGQLISVTRDNVGSFTPSTGDVPELSNTEYSGYGHPSFYKFNQIDNDLVQRKDIRLIFRSTTAPLINDLFTIGSSTYTALNIKTIMAQGSNIYYEVQLR